MNVLASIYKSPKKNDMYLYLLKADRLSKVPQALSTLFGKPEHVMDILLTPERQLARVEPWQVIEALNTRGFYLQMPTPEDDYIEHLPDELLTRNDPA
ncbi:YcgL domain-containing protein [Candidatus Sororendozoicomonas aggregata]|uniref:YcgL domain-containing protein n=1 Tax=Candidatus Sororendozoicomonas aggregata TaxID=3073239 RepID=UPI002ED25997